MYSDIDWCSVGDVSNPPLQDGRGAVGYPFEIAKVPVTNRQYCVFLNSLPVGESEGLFSNGMADHFFGGILRNDTNAERFQPKKGFENKPVVFVSWLDARRYADWLCGQDTEWAYRLPTADEWFKAAAFHSTRGWTKYLTGNNERPSQDPDQKNSANYYDFRLGWALPAPHLADVDLYRQAGPYGTLGQAGNCAEWVDAAMPNGWKLALGGSLFRPIESLLVTSTEGDAPEKRLSTFGFRLVRVKKDGGGTLNAQRSTLNAQVIGRGDGSPNCPRTPRGDVPTGTAVRRGTGILTVFHGRDAHATRGSADYVVIDHPFNPPDTLFGRHGRVDYVFEMARHAVTNRDYATFLNAVASRNDPFGLFHKDMETGVLGGIVRTSRSGAWFYEAKPGWEEKPVVYIDYFSAARYANWLHFGSPVSGMSELGTTEGNDKMGAYNTRRFAAYLAGDRRGLRQIGRRNPGARYWIPGNDEWYKAAYYDPVKPGSHKYWEFPTRSSCLPGLQDNDDGHAANYQRADSLAVGPPYYLADVQAYAASASFYGTVQQGGNVWEWLEDFRYTRDGILCGLRGGSFGYTETGLHAGNEDLVSLGTRSYVFGLRMARAATAEGWQAVRSSRWRTFAGKVLHRIARRIEG